ncbi:MAG: N-acetylmuramoyl-L-alanine amidase [Gammaproteobacteria bacterium]
MLASAPMPAAPFQVDLLPYAGRLQRRDVGDIDLAVVHCTELPDLATARAYAERVLYPDSGTGNSGHWYIDRDGGTWQYLPHDRIAHHVRGHNPRSVGIELVNTGRYPDWLDSRRQAMAEPYPEAQLDALLRLLQRLREELPSLHWIAGHEDLDTEQVAASDDPTLRVRRKRDPGPMFPWARIQPACGLRRLLP